jgi:hypothetical protein
VDDVNHMLCRVDACRAWRTVASEVLSNDVRVITDITKVNCLATAGQEKKCIELGEELSARS